MGYMKSLEFTEQGEGWNPNYNNYWHQKTYIEVKDPDRATILYAAMGIR